MHTNRLVTLTVTARATRKRCGASAIRWPTSHSRRIYSSFSSSSPVTLFVSARRRTSNTFSGCAWKTWRWIFLIFAVVKITADNHSIYKLPNFRPSGASQPLFGEAMLLFLMSNSAFRSDRASNPVKSSTFTLATSAFTVKMCVFGTRIRISIELVPTWRFSSNLYVWLTGLGVIVPPYYSQ